MYRCVAGSICLLAVLTLLGCDSAPAKDKNRSAKRSSKATKDWSPNAWMKDDLAPPKKAPPVAQPPRQDVPPNPTERPKTGPGWQCLSAVHDFGEIWEGKVVRHRFEFQNVGTASLVIPKPKAHCSCSSAEDWSKEVAPGQTGYIPFTLKTRNKFGTVQEYLDIKTNDPSVPATRVWMKGVVKTVCQSEVIEDAKATTPALLKAVKKRKGYFDKIKTDDRLHRVVRLRNTSGSPLTLEMVPPRVAGAQFKFDFRVVEPGEVFDVTIDGEPPFPIGRHGTTLRFKTNVAERPYYSLPVVATVPERIEVVPSKIVVDERSSKTKRRHIRIINNGKTPIKVTGLAVSDPAYKVTILGPNPKRPKEIRIQVLLPDGDYRPPPYGEVVRIETSDPEKPVIERMVLPHLRDPATPRPADKPLEMHAVEM